MITRSGVNRHIFPNLATFHQITQNVFVFFPLVEEDHVEHVHVIKPFQITRDILTLKVGYAEHPRISQANFKELHVCVRYKCWTIELHKK